MGQSVKGKAAIVTGAGSGINLEFARLLLQHGAHVLIADLSLRPEAKALVDAHRTEGPRCIFVKTDVTSWPALQQTFEVAQHEFGSIDTVCPGAGIYEPSFSSFWHPPGHPPSKDDPTLGHYASLDINLTHPIRMTQLAISHFLSGSIPASPTNPKSIVLVSSISGQITPMLSPLYVAAKHGFNGFVRSLAQLEPKTGIRVTAVAPGVVKTPIWLDNKEKMTVIDKDQVWVTPEEVATAMLALVEDDEISTGFEGQENIKIRGGTILENGSKTIRDVQAFNDPGPMHSTGRTTNDPSRIEAEIWESLASQRWGM